MSNAPPLTLFLPDAPDAPDAEGITPRVHIGDLHKTLACVQHHCDLIAIVDNVNSAFASSIAFMFLPGDVADDGSDIEDTVVCGALDAWEGYFIEDQLPADGAHDLLPKMGDADGGTTEHNIRCVFGDSANQTAGRKERDQDTAWRTGPNAVRSALISAQTSMGESGR